VPYTVRSPYSDAAPVEINEGEFVALRATMKCLRLYLGIEENFEAIVQMYIELQTMLASETIAAALRDSDWNDFADVRLRINISLAKFLSLARQYLDHTSAAIYRIRRITKCDGGGDFAKATNAQYDKSLGYRVMEALRNCTQHSMAATQSVRFRGQRVDDGNGAARREHMMEPRWVLGELRENKKFKSKVLKEIEDLEAKGESPSVMRLLKEYCNGFAELHLDLRTDLQNSYSAWRKKVDDLLARCREGFGDHSAVYISDEGRGLTEVVMRELHERIEHLRGRNAVRQFMFDFHIKTE